MHKIYAQGRLCEVIYSMLHAPHKIYAEAKFPTEVFRGVALHRSTVLYPLWSNSRWARLGNGGTPQIEMIESAKYKTFWKILEISWEFYKG